MRKILAWLDRLDQRMFGPQGWLPRLGTQRPMTRRQFGLFAVVGFLVMMGLGVAFRQVGPLSALRGDESLWESVLGSLPLSFLPALIAFIRYFGQRPRVETDLERRSRSSK